MSGAQKKIYFRFNTQQTEKPTLQYCTHYKYFWKSFFLYNRWIKRAKPQHLIHSNGGFTFGFSLGYKFLSNEYLSEIPEIFCDFAIIL